MEAQHGRTHLTNLFITSSSDRHHDLNDTQLFAQVVIDSVIEQTVPVEKDPRQPLWKLKGGIEVAADITCFTVSVLRGSINQGSKLLGSIEINFAEILTQSVEETHEFTLKLVKENDNAPSLEFASVWVHFPPASPYLPDGMLLFVLYRVIAIIQLKIEVDLEFMVSLYGTIIPLSDTCQGKCILFNMLGHIHLDRYIDFDNINDLNDATSTYGEAVRLNPDGHPEKPDILDSLCDSFHRRFERLGNISDIDNAIVVLEDAVGLTPDDHPLKLPRLSKLGSLFLSRFQRIGDVRDIDDAITIYDDVLALTADGHPTAASRLNDLAISFRNRFERLGNIDDIDCAVTVHEDALGLTPDDHPNMPTLLNNLGNSLLCRFQHVGDIRDIDDGIAVHEDALGLVPDDHPNMPTLLSSLSHSFYSRFEQLGDIRDIDDAIKFQDDALGLTEDDHPDLISQLHNLGTLFLSRFTCLGNIGDIDRAITVCEDGIGLTPDDHPILPTLLNHLGNSFLCRFQRIGDIRDIDDAIAVHEDALGLIPDDHPNKPTALSNLSNSLHSRFVRLGDINDIDHAIIVLKDAIELITDDRPHMLALLGNLGNSFASRFECLGDIRDINNAITIYKDAMTFVTDGHPKKPTLLGNLGNSLHIRFERFGDIRDISNAITYHIDAVRLTADGHAERASHLSDLGSSFRSRFERLGNIDDIDNAITIHEDAVELTPDDHPDIAFRLGNLGISFCSRFVRLSDIGDIDRAITVYEDALGLTPDDHPMKPTFLGNLGNSLYLRFERLGDISDIDNAVMFHNDAVNLTASDHTRKPTLLKSLGDSLQSRFVRLGDIRDIDNAITIHGDAVGLTPDDHPHKPVSLGSLGSSFHSRFESFGDINDIDRAIMAHNDAVRLIPDGHPNKHPYLTNLGNSLLSRFQRLGDIDDNDRAITVLEEAVALTPDGHPDKPTRQTLLGNSFLSRIQLGDISAHEKAILPYSGAASSPTGSPLVRFRASANWAECARFAAHPSQLDAYTCALELLPQLAWLGLPLNDRHRMLTKAGNVTSDAAAAAIEFKKYATAVEWLEQGRSIVWGQLLQLRTPVDKLREHEPALAARLSRVSVQLEHASSRDPADLSNNNMSLEQAAQWHRRLTLEWNELVKEVQSVTGFEDFLQPKKLSQLATVARSGPVVLLNVSSARSDALILIPHQEDVLHLPLPSFTYEQAQRMQESFHGLLSNSGRCVLFDRASKLADIVGLTGDVNREFENILSHLWVHVAKPVLKFLKFLTKPTGELPRIWWCPTGPLAFLPIHAAGLYNTNLPGSKLSDFVISSYTPTLSALIEDPQRSQAKGFRLLAVCQPSALGQASLPGTREELKRIQRHAGKLNMSSLVESEATVERVADSMRESNWVHFACHGVQDTNDPTDSGLLLAESSRLKLSDIIKMSLPHANLAFLSACQTATGAEGLSEEAVHLAAGMLLAGYRGVIATMWSIMDRDAPSVADDVYGQLFKEQTPDHTQAARALHYAVQRLRESLPNASYLSWVPFIHIGV